MKEQFYFVYGCDADGNPTDKRVTDEEHLQNAIETAKKDFNGMKIYVNKACFCFNGYLVQSDYVGRFD